MKYRPILPEEDDWEQGGFVSDAAPRDYDLEGGFVCFVCTLQSFAKAGAP